LDPSITEVYKPKRPEKVNVVDSSKAKPQQKVSNYLERMKLRKIAAWKKKMKKKSKVS
jgi:hypothetical protein